MEEKGLLLYTGHHKWRFLMFLMMLLLLSQFAFSLSEEAVVEGSDEGALPPQNAFFNVSYPPPAPTTNSSSPLHSPPTLVHQATSHMSRSRLALIICVAILGVYSSAATLYSIYIYFKNNNNNNKVEAAEQQHQPPLGHQ